MLRIFTCCVLLCILGFLSLKVCGSTGLTLKKTRRSIRLPPWSQKVIAGGAGRAMAQALLYPVDALRTLAQTRDGRTLADVGLEALSKGCIQTSSFALFQGAIQFGIFGAVNEHAGPLIASALGAAGSCIVSVPQEVLKQRLVTGVYGSFREAIATIFRTEGLAGFYSGWKPTITRNIPFVITTFTTIDILERKMLAKRRKKGSDAGFSATENLIIGIGSAMIGIMVTQPFDVVKTRMITQAASTAVPYKSALECFLSILRTEGMAKLYSGVKQRGVYQCGLWGITFAINGILRKKLREEEAKKK